MAAECEWRDAGVLNKGTILICVMECQIFSIRMRFLPSFPFLISFSPGTPDR